MKAPNRNFNSYNRKCFEFSGFNDIRSALRTTGELVELFWVNFVLLMVCGGGRESLFLYFHS